MPRSEPGAVVHETDQIVERSIKLATEGKVIAVDGTEIEFSADSICLHGDTPGAVETAAAVRGALEDAGVKITPMAKLVSGV